MRQDRWPQIVLEHKPKCQTCRGGKAGGKSGGGGEGVQWGAARTMLPSRGEKPGALRYSGAQQPAAGALPCAGHWAQRKWSPSHQGGHIGFNDIPFTVVKERNKLTS